MQTFKHSGELGDIIYSLPVVKKLGGGMIYLELFWEPASFNEKTANMLKPLLLSQPYVEATAFCNGEKIDYDLDKFRNLNLNLGFTNLAESHLRAFDLPVQLMNDQWLHGIGKKKVFDRNVVFHRSPRHHSENFPWKNLTERFKGHAVFVGLREEHEQFIRKFGSIPFHQVYDFLELAEIINGADFFFGNQSFPFAISEGLHKQNCLEIYKKAPNCNFKRNGHNMEIRYE